MKGHSVWSHFCEASGQTHRDRNWTRGFAGLEEPGGAWGRGFLSFWGCLLSSYCVLGTAVLSQFCETSLHFAGQALVGDAGC